MKYFYLLIFLISLSSLRAQERDDFKTLIGSKKVGGYGSFSLGYTSIDTSGALILSARGGVVLGHAFALGIGGSGFVTEYKDNPSLNKKGSLTGGYGGMFMELILFGKAPVHVSIPVLAGFGGAAYTVWENEGTDYEKVNYIDDISTYFVLEPGIELEFNITKYFRLAGYFNYRYTSDIDITTASISGEKVQLVKPDALNTYSAGLIFKFGKF